MVARRKAASPVDRLHLGARSRCCTACPRPRRGPCCAEDGERTTFYAGSADDRALSYRDRPTIATISRPARRRSGSCWRPTEGDPPYELVTVTADPAEGEASPRARRNLVETVPMPRTDRARSLRRSSPSTMSSGSSSSASATAQDTEVARRGAAMEITTNERRTISSRAGRGASARSRRRSSLPRSRPTPVAAPKARSRRAKRPSRAEFDIATLAADRIDQRGCPTSRRSCSAGVPADLTRAALRRVWTADPAIRDFVGLAENAWDFTEPDAMPGFGPLEATDEVRRMIAAGRAADRRRRRNRAHPRQSAGSVEVAENSSDSNVINASRVTGSSQSRHEARCSQAKKLPRFRQSSNAAEQHRRYCSAARPSGSTGKTKTIVTPCTMAARCPNNERYSLELLLSY